MAEKQMRTVRSNVKVFFAGIKKCFACDEEGKTGMMITLDRNGDDPYQCGTSAYDIHAIANVERPVPAEWITEDGCGLNEGYEKYARPLIMGELQPLFVNGLPRHLVRK